MMVEVAADAATIALQDSSKVSEGCDVSGDSYNGLTSQ